eukprot:jgi/Botrbrau1/17256/Bobra.0015s0015.1
MATALSNSGKGFHVSNDTDLFIDDSLWIPCNNVPQNTPRVELTPWKCGCCSATASSLIGSFIEGHSLLLLIAAIECQISILTSLPQAYWVSWVITN